MSKGEHERKVFREFAALAGLAVAPDSIRSEDPPLPDISCSIDGRRHFFELTRATDQQLADDTGRLLTKARRTGEGGVGPFVSYDDRDSLKRAVARKAALTHETGGDPLSLLVYYDAVFNPLASLEIVEPTFRILQAKYRHRWASLWLFDPSAGRVLGR